MSLREVSQYYINSDSNINKIDSSSSIEEYDDWDADRIYGCLCDEGWEGFACDKRKCLSGPDPYIGGVDEVQLIECQCHSSSCTGINQINCYENLS